MATKLIITITVETDEFDESAGFDAEAAVKDTMKEWGYDCETSWRTE